MSWSDKSLDELGTVSRGRSRHRPRDAAHLYGGPYPFVQTGDVKRAGLYLSDYSQTYSDEGLAQSKLWPTGTLCITIAANIADTSILAIDACFPDSVIGFIPDPKKSDARFIKYLFDAVLKLQYRQVSQGAAQDNLSQGKLLALKFSVPDDVNEQIRIADFIATYDDLIENNRRRIKLLEESARLLYQEWFVNLRFPGHEQVNIIGGVPEGWVMGKVSDFIDTSSGGTPSRKFPEYYTGEIPWVKTQELKGSYIYVTSEYITEEAIKKSSAKVFPAGTVLVAMYGATIGETGIIAIEAATNQACCALMPKRETLSREFIHLFAMQNKQGLINLSQGAAQNNISQQTIKNYPFLMPSQLILKEFNELVSDIYSQKANLEKQIVSLIKARDLLLPKLMSGELAV
ncbi:restriction endonuclease subunit S [Vibrio vulnificus]|uniref:restriction endonuclease subunit S n=1 Tax=Vibrio TaxID=662 RepID=UPI0015948614|nr:MULTISPECIES: restriction endonuclease subunit S [Vibrio]EKF9451727.1 restriction endonuclease subunit S [Vibrio cholerae]EGQ7851179.1 restriction endonuclease subunit S [Vibrio vulnificus]EHD0100909.1 restriction endonuclease subunit S [Vibrio vulnificus]EHH2478722.1 restriction endonuclease subunit S [Vibrio vulnificus]EIE1227260.1 restriction endonuclease subunit S [Vibrio vulnificus]